MKYTAQEFYDIYSEDDDTIDQWLTIFYNCDPQFKQIDESRDIPISCPWLWRNAAKIILHGESIEDMVYNYIKDIKMYDLLKKEGYKIKSYISLSA
jgi:hypothetical protein